MLPAPVPVVATVSATVGVDAARVTVTVYVFVVVPSCAVTTVVMVFAPTERAIAPDALPEATVVPFTVMVAVASATVGVTVRLVTLFATDCVYAVVAASNTGLSVPLLNTRLLKSALVDGTKLKMASSYVTLVCPIVPKVNVLTRNVY